MADKAIGILFEVKGGIEGESYKLIQTQLSEISEKIKLQINIDEDHFTAQLKTLKNAMQREMGNVQINPSGGTNSSSDIKEQKVELKEIYAQLEKIYSLRVKIDKAKEGGILYVKSTRELQEQEKILQEQITAYGGINKEIEEYQARLEKAAKIDVQASATAQSKLQDKAAALYTDNGFDEVIKRSTEARRLVDNFNNSLNEALNRSGGTLTKQQVEELNTEFVRTHARLKEIQRETDTVGNSIKKAFSDKVIQRIAFVLMMTLIRALKQVYDNIVKIDTAMTQLKIVTQASGDELEKYAESVAKSAKKIGASITDLIESTTTYARLGYSLKDASVFAELTTMYSKVSGVSVDEATTNLTAMIKAYNISSDKLRGAIDRLVYVGNNYAISSAEIGEAMNNAASSLAANGNSLDESIAILTAANATLQDVSKASTAVRTIAARISASKMELENLGEDVTNIISTADIDKKMRAFGVAVSDANGNLRSTYDILNDLSGVWDSLKDTERASIVEMLAGKRQQNALYSIMQNWEDARSVVDSTSKSVDALQKGYDKYIDSIQGKLAQLTASWEDFSQKVLDSALIKTIVDILKWIVERLNDVASVGDGILVTIPLIVTSLYALWAVLVKIKATTVWTTFYAGIKGVLAVFPALLAGLKSVYLNIVAQTAARKGLTTALAANMAATKAATAANEAFNATNPVGWIILAVSALVLLVKGLSSWIDTVGKASEVSKKAKEAYEDANEELEKSRENFKELTSLTEEFVDATKGINNDETFNAELRQKILEIQTRITSLVGNEADNLDLVNDKLNISLDKLAQLKAAAAKDEYQKALGAYAAAKDSSNKAYESYDAGTGGFDWFGLSDPSKFYQMVLQRGSDGSKYAEDVYNIIVGMDDRILIAKDATWGDEYYGIDFREGMSAAEMVQVLNEVIDAMTSQNLAAGSPDIYSAFVKMRDSYQSYLDSEANAMNELLNSVVNMKGFEAYSEGQEIKNIEDYRQFRQNLLDAVNTNSYIADMLNDGTTTAKAVQDSIDNWLAQWYSDWYDKNAQSSKGVIINLKTFLEIMKEVESEFDALNQALTEINQNGAIASDTIEKLLTTYPDLLDKYFKMTDQGFVLNDDYSSWDLMDILSDYATKYLQQYVDDLSKAEEGTEEYAKALENFNKAKAVMATLIRSQAIKSEASALNKQKDALNEQLNVYKDLISLRKDLLETYQKEYEYQKELAKKQQNVADLQTQLNLARLDNSASGQARVRELQKQLENAKEELDEFTLDKAIDVLTDKLDSQYDEYKKFIDDEISKLEEAINNIAKNIAVALKIPEANKPQAEQEQPVETQTTSKTRWTSYQDAVDAGFANIAGASASERGRVKNWVNPETGNKYQSYQEYLDVMYKKYMGKTPVYHSGGLVGGIALKSSEEFAKLLKGEYVSTPKQMDNFIKNTLPSIVNAAGTGATFEYNSPLITIQCDSINEDSLPRLQEIVNEAVKQIGRQMEGALSRTGYKKKF